MRNSSKFSPRIGDGIQLKYGEEYCRESLKLHIRHHMDTKNIGNNDLAKKLRIGQSALSEIRNDVRLPSIRTFFIIRDFLLYGYKRKTATRRSNQFKKTYLKLLLHYRTVYGSQIHLSGSTRIPRETLNNFQFNRSNSPDLGNACIICEYFDLTVEEVLNYPYDKLGVI